MSNTHSPQRSGLVADLVVILGAVVFGAGTAAIGVGVLGRPLQVGTIIAGVLALLIGIGLVSFGVSLDQADANRRR